jgi:DNA-directed RNA polymerase subunit M/transcription elongation factor TFIIS
MIFVRKAPIQVNTMDFCPKCGSILQTAKKGSSILRCPKCKYEKPMEHKESSKKISFQHGKEAEIAVIDQTEEAMLRQHPTIHLVCEKCGNTESETWNVEAADETIHSTITFFRCTKCKTTTRESG